MTAEIRVWRIQKDDHLHPVKSSKLDVEARLEDWIEEDISILSNDFLVIGRQVATEYGGAIDLLCLDRQGGFVAGLQKHKASS
jgi:RecB family endonuclease NucS